MTRDRLAKTGLLVAVVLSAARAGPRAGAAEDHPGLVIYREHCLRCHGERGVGTTAVPEPLVGDRSLNQLAAYIDEAMPEDDPTLVDAAAARSVADYIHGDFYSAVARDRNRPARPELMRLTARQHRTALADLVGGFRPPAPADDGRRGLVGDYFATRLPLPEGRVFQRLDPDVDFDFGVEGPDPERFRPGMFSIQWVGSLVPPETGRYEFVLQTPHAARLWINMPATAPPLIDATVNSGGDDTHRATLFLLGGRPYPLRLDFAKANQGVADDRHPPAMAASIRLSWIPPHGGQEVVPRRCLLPLPSPPVFVPQAGFPADDRSIGYERGTSVGPEWFAAATAAAAETAEHVITHLEDLSGAAHDAADVAPRLRDFAATFADRGFRRPLTADLYDLMIDRPFSEAPDPETALRRSILLVLSSPRFLYLDAVADDAFASAARLSFGLWDSLPDAALRAAAATGRLADPDERRRQAERMVDDWRTRAKVRDFLFSWLRIDLGPELVKDAAVHPAFSPEVAGDLRTSLGLFLEETVWRSGDFRRLFTDDEVFVNGRLAPLYGASLPAEAPFRRLRLDAGARGGVLSHPYLMSVLSYPAATSPIHRGVFLARTILGNVLKPPAEAIAPLAPDRHPELTTRERVALQTSAVACQTCHTLINPLGFALEEFDEIGRLRGRERVGGTERPIDAAGAYLPREGPEVAFRGARELAAYVATSRDAREAFVQAMFHAVVKQPVRAWGPETLSTLGDRFAETGFDIRRLLVDIMMVSVIPPSADEGGRVTQSSAQQRR